MTYATLCAPTRHCPAWCDDHHDEADADSRSTTHKAVAADTTGTGGEPIRVGLRAFDLHIRGTEPVREATVWADAGYSDGLHRVEGLTAEDARTLGLALIAAADRLAKGA